MTGDTIRDFLDELEESENPERFVARRRQSDDRIDELAELVEAHRQGDTTHRSIAHALDIETGVAWRALEVLPEDGENFS